MAKFELTIKGVTGTINKDETPVESLDLKMVAGTTPQEAYCYYSAEWELKTVIQKSKEEKETKITKGKGPLSFAFNIQTACFTKQMYSPNEIAVEIQMAAGSSKKGDESGTETLTAWVSKEILEGSFCNKNVVLKCDDKEVCNDYFVFDVEPTYKSDATYIKMRMYSPDKLMTLEPYCRSFLSKKLSEIVQNQLPNYEIPYNNSTISFPEKLYMKHIVSNGKEHIFPYLVQYNETFYDFLKRTTNRWGEYLFYEDNQLNIGYDDSGTKPELKGKYTSLTYQDLTTKQPEETNAGDYFGEASCDPQILNNPMEKGKFDAVRGEINSLAHPSLDLDKYIFKKFGNLMVNDKTLFGFLVDQGVEDGLAFAQADSISSDLNKTFNNSYFDKKNKAHTRFDDDQYSNKTKFNQFSEFAPILDSKKYDDIIEKEMASGRNAVIMEFDTTYPDVDLGQVVKIHDKEHLVVKVECYQPKMYIIEDEQRVVITSDPKQLCYRVTAIPTNRVLASGEDTPSDKKYYPQFLPTGHVRHSGPQLAKVVDADDPLRQNRVRVKFDWQSDKDDPTPWLVYATPASTKKAGIHGKHYKDEPVMVAYTDANIEHPYVIGAVEPDHPLPLNVNDIVYSTPAGQRILMSDGYGAGLTAFLSSLNPCAKLIQGFVPGGDMFKFDSSKSFEGSIELRDTYGMWSIKGCTDQRRVSIKSLWGDVEISAFTGITISAPNGDIKIKGKNVSIEAGSNLTLTSGKNIEKKFLWEGEKSGSLALMAANAAKEVAKKLASKVASLIDVTVIRHLVEIFVKPVEGRISINSGRYLMLGAGGVKPDYPVDAYKKPKSDDKRDRTLQGMKHSFELVNSIVKQIIDFLKSTYRDGIQARAALDRLVGKCKDDTRELQCKATDDIIKAIWDNPNMDKDALKSAFGFKGLFKDLGDNDKVDDKFIHYFVPANTFAMLDPEMEEQAAKVAQKKRKQAMIDAAENLRVIIKRLNDVTTNFNNEVALKINPNQPEPGMNYDSLKKVMKKDNLPKSPIKDIKGADYEKLRLFKLSTRIWDNYLKPARRAFHIKLISELGFERAGINNDPTGMTKPKAPAEPKPDCDDRTWADFVNSIQVMPKKKEDKGLLDELVKDPMLEASGIKGWNEFKDDFAFGSSKNGQILFSSHDGTMVLERNIYRANVDHDDVPLEDQFGVLRSYVYSVRNILMQA
jgi:hypothetical protein